VIPPLPVSSDTRGTVTHFVAGIGTSGTMMGVGRFLKERNPRVRLIAVQPDDPLHGMEGLKHLATAIVPPIYDPTVADETVYVSTERADATVRELARNEGLFVGWSAGAALAVARDILDKDAVIVAVAPDSGNRYLSESRRRLET